MSNNPLTGIFLAISLALFFAGILFARDRDYRKAYWANVLALLSFGAFHHAELYL